MQAEERHDSVRQGLVMMLPRLKRFAEILLGEPEAATAFLRRALVRMLEEQSRYQRGTMLDRWAFAEMYRQWLQELRDHAHPLLRPGGASSEFTHAFEPGADELDGVTVDLLGQLPPQQRCALLLVYGEGLDHEDAAQILDSTADSISARLLRASSSLADRLSSDTRAPTGATVQTLYPHEQGATND